MLCYSIPHTVQNMWRLHRFLRRTQKPFELTSAIRTKARIAMPCKQDRIVVCHRYDFRGYCRLPSSMSRVQWPEARLSLSSQACHRLINLAKPLSRPSCLPCLNMLHSRKSETRRALMLALDSRAGQLCADVAAHAGAL